MNIKINYGTGVATLPTAALGSIDRATKNDVKLLFFLCAEPSLLSCESYENCLSRICARTGLSIGQIESALAFWRGVGVLELTENDTIEAETAPAPTESAHLAEEAPAAVSEPCEAPQPTPAATADSAVTVTPAVTVTRAKVRMLDEIPVYTTEEIESFMTRNREASTYLDECQCAWGGMFNQRDSVLIISLVDTWGLSWNYVISLLAYCSRHFRERGNQGKTLNYVYRMAAEFHKEGILTDEALQQKFVDLERMNDFERRIRALFGLGERNLTPKEKKYLSTWIYEYQYDIEIVEMAYNITVDTKGSPNMNYTNGILKHWYEDGLATLEAIVAKREAESTAVKAIREGELTPERATVAVESILNAEPKGSTAQPSANIAQDINILRRLLSLGNRMLTDGEIAAFTRWRTEFGFRYEIIYYAYQITLENRRQYNLPYMDAILSKWHGNNLTTIEAVRAYDKGFKEEKERAKQRASKAPFNAPQQNSSFDTSDFFMAAVKRSMGEDFDPAILDQ